MRPLIGVGMTVRARQKKGNGLLQQGQYTFGDNGKMGVMANLEIVKSKLEAM